jgi:ABC-type Fe3+ transport system substrate-binding protein
VVGKLSVAVSVLLALGSVAGCGASAAPAQLQTLEQRMASLYPDAKAEGTVSFYSSMNPDDAQKILPRFEAQFPGVKVAHLRGTPSQISQRIVTERKSGQNQFDVLETTALDASFLVNQGYTQPYRVASWDDFPALARDGSERWIGDRLINDLPGLNTSKVAAGTITVRNDLCDSKYRGHIAVETEDVAVYIALKQIMGRDEAQRLIQCVAANRPVLVSSQADLVNRLAAGEFWATFSAFGHRLAQLKHVNNAAIDWVHTDPVITDMTLMALASQPAHPKAARLLMEWLASPSGQQAIADTGRAPASTRVKAPYPDLTGTTRVFYITPALGVDYEADAAVWRQTFGIP